MAIYRCARNRCFPCYDSTCYSSDIHTFLPVHCTCTRRCTCARVFRTSRVRVFIALVTIHRRTPSQVLPRPKLGYASEYLQTRRTEFSSLLIPFLSLSFSLSILLCHLYGSAFPLFLFLRVSVLPFPADTETSLTFLLYARRVVTLMSAPWFCWCAFVKARLWRCR